MPVAILSALLALEMVAGIRDVPVAQSAYRWVAIAVVAVLVIRSRSLILAITAGMAALALLRLI